jgi:excisionase family DNA binding protein
MARPEVTGRKQINQLDQYNADAYSISEFCARHGISVQLFYKLKQQGLMPATFNVGTRVLISREAAAEWRRARESTAA